MSLLNKVSLANKDIEESRGIEIVSEGADGTPRGERHIAVWNPPLLNSIADAKTDEKYLPDKKIETSIIVQSHKSTFSPIPAIFEPLSKLNNAEKILISPSKIEAAMLRFTEDISVPGDAETGLGVPDVRGITWKWGSTSSRNNLNVEKAPANSQNQNLKLLKRLYSEANVDFTDSTESRRRCYLNEAAQIFSSLVSDHVRTLVFCKSRRLVELFLERALMILKETNSTLCDRIGSYRGGYTKETRRDIENNLNSGQLIGLVATNALELGIDIGTLDVTIHVGFPSSINSLWQQMGRCGRSSFDGMSIIVCAENACDQYIASHPALVFERDCEASYLDPYDEVILMQQLQCAAAEIPLNSMLVSGIQVDSLLWGNDFTDHCENLLRQELLFDRSASKKLKLLSASNVTCSRGVNIRSCNVDSFSVFDASKNKLIDTVEYFRAFTEVFEGAIYLNQGKRYLVYKFDLDGRAAYCRPLTVRLPYYTRMERQTSITVINIAKFASIPFMVSNNSDSSTEIRELLKLSANYATGRIKITKSSSKLVKYSCATDEIIEIIDALLPPIDFETNSFWIDIPHAVAALLDDAVSHRGRIQAIHSACHALQYASALTLQCDFGDLDCPHDGENARGVSRLLIYDSHMGGSGLSKSIFENRHSIMKRAIDILSTCNCECNGCPACVFTLTCPLNNASVSKSSGLLLLQLLTTHQISVESDNRYLNSQLDTEK